MNKTLFAMLTETEKRLLLSTEPAALRDLDEDDLATLHDRVRRARNKYSSLYRRRASERVGRDATRGRAHDVNIRTARKAEVFEDALARVSRHLARAAAATAQALKADRLQAAQRGASTPPAVGRRAVQKKVTGTAHVQRRTPARKRASAQARAATRRKQAARAGR